MLGVGGAVQAGGVPLDGPHHPGGRQHHPAADGVEDHAIAVDGRNPDGCTTPEEACGHQHGPDCGHPAVPHGGHTDYLVDGRLHHPHEGHCDDHGPLDRA